MVALTILPGRTGMQRALDELRSRIERESRFGEGTARDGSHPSSGCRRHQARVLRGGTRWGVAPMLSDRGLPGHRKKPACAKQNVEPGA